MKLKSVKNVIQDQLSKYFRTVYSEGKVILMRFIFTTRVTQKYITGNLMLTTEPKR